MKYFRFFHWQCFQWKKRDRGGIFSQKRDHCIAILEKEPAPVNERIMTIRLSLQKKLSATFISINALTDLEEIKKQFYSDLINCVNWLRHKEVERGF